MACTTYKHQHTSQCDSPFAPGSRAARKGACLPPFARSVYKALTPG